MTAIETRYMPATDGRGSRIKAKWRERNLPFCSVPNCDEIDSISNHRIALDTLIEKTNASMVKEPLNPFPFPDEGWHPGETEHGYVWINKGY